jgi:hypothetical protein
MPHFVTPDKARMLNKMYTQADGPRIVSIWLTDRLGLSEETCPMMSVDKSKYVYPEVMDYALKQFGFFIHPNCKDSYNCVLLRQRSMKSGGGIGGMSPDQCRGKLGRDIFCNCFICKKCTPERLRCDKCNDPICLGCISKHNLIYHSRDKKPSKPTGNKRKPRNDDDDKEDGGEYKPDDDDDEKIPRTRKKRQQKSTEVKDDLKSKKKQTKSK